MRWFLRRGLRWVILILVALFIFAFLWFAPQRQVEYSSQKVPAKERPALVNEYRRTWAQIIGGFGLLLGLYFTWRRVEIAQDQQVTERFTRAIDQLGATDDKTGEPRLEIRLGGIYALERIAMDSPKRDYSTVMEVLTAYVRENAPWPPKTSKVEPISSGAPPTDIQAILTVIARRTGNYGSGETEPLDLQGTDLRGSSALAGRAVHLERAFLPMTNLIEANLQEANLQEANLFGANLFGANLQGAKLQEANLKDAYLRGANLFGANLQGAVDLTQAQIEVALGNKDTRLPESLQRPEDWSKNIEEQKEILEKRFSAKPR